MQEKVSSYLLTDMFQISKLKKVPAYLLILQLFTLTTPALSDGQFYVIWRDIGLADATRLVSQYSGRAIELDQQLRGTINLASTDPLSPDEVFMLFQESLQERGLALVRIDDKRYQIRGAEPISALSPDMPTSAALAKVSNKQQEALPLTAVSQNKESLAQSPRGLSNPSVKAEANASPQPAAIRRHVGAIFTSELRAQSIAARLRAAGAEVEVLAPTSSTDNDFSIVLLYRDTAQDHQALVAAIQQAGLNNLIATPTLSVGAVLQK